MSEKTHPDDVMQMMAKIAKEHGYVIANLELIGMHGVNGENLPMHSYGSDPIVVRDKDGRAVCLS